MSILEEVAATPVFRRIRSVAEAWVAASAKLAWLWLGLLLVGFGTCHVLASRHHSDFGIDGGFYAAIAVKVRDGYGLTTNCSILHKGDLSFPAPTSAYPLWPLLWGYLSRIFPLAAAARWLPAALYLVALLFSYLWAHRTHPRAFFPRLLPGFQAGHVMVIVLGLSKFFAATLQPEVEGLAYALMFAAFWRYTKLWVAPSWKAGLEMGAWAGAVLLARPQLVVSAGVAFLLLGYAVLFCRDLRVQYVQMLVACVVAFVAVAAPWFIYTWSFAPDASVGQVLAFASVRPNHILSSLQGLRPVTSLGSWFSDRLSGFPIAYAWGTNNSYSVQYFTFQYAVVFVLPCALIALVWRLARGGFGAMRAWLVDPANLPRLYALGYGTAAFLALHVMHTTAWYFHRRHGLGSVVFIAAMVACLLLFENFIPKLLGVAILASGVWFGGHQLRDDTEQSMHARPWRAGAVAAWIQRQAGKEPALVIAMRRPQEIAYRLPNQGFHWYNKETTSQDLELMVTELGVHYVAVPDVMSPWWHARGKHFEYVTQLGDETLYRPNGALRSRAKKPDAARPANHASADASSFDGYARGGAACARWSSERIATGPSASTTAIALSR
jgi:hypothetical protein